MSIPTNITGNHLQKAIEKIDREGIPPGGHSSTYDVVYHGKRYPPKLVVSYANFFANKEILDRATFSGGLDTQCFNLLEKNNFRIIKKTDVLERKVWIEKTIVKDRQDRLSGERALGKAVWSPKQAKNGADIYKNMRDVNPEDIIIHLVDNEIFKGISVAEKSAQDAPGVPTTPWDSDSYFIPLKGYKPLDPPLPKSEVLNRKNEQSLFKFSESSEVFYTKDLKLRQGAYLTPCNPDLLKYINTIYKEKSGKDLPYVNETSIFNTSISFKSDEVKEETNSFKKGQIAINSLEFLKDAEIAGLKFSNKLINRFVSSLTTKPFVILTGLSGSGKTKLAQAFATWICESNNQYRIVPVGADWTNREPLLGYPNAIEQEEYVPPENGMLDFLLEAKDNLEKPYFLILDEMNLSHVERYFADFLSIMETGEDITLYDGKKKNGAPPKISWTRNVFIVGTVNIDETTYMFSPKVLDRANTIEFRITAEEMTAFLQSNRKPDLSAIQGKGANMATDFLRISSIKNQGKLTESLNQTLLRFFTELKKTGAEFGYRSANEMYHLLHNLSILDGDLTEDEKIDIAVMQKLLPKLHGSRKKLVPVLKALGNICVTNDIQKVEEEVFKKLDFPFEDNQFVKFPLSLEKLSRMYNGVIENGFTSYAEA